MPLDNLIDGRAIAEQVHAETAARIAQLKSRGVQPGLAFVRVGEDPASKVYVGMKEKLAVRLGIASQTMVLPEQTTQAELLTLIARLNADQATHGILVQAPLPAHIDEAVIFTAVSPAKDVDGFHPLNVGKLMLGDSTGFVPCTPAGVHELLIRSQVKVEGAHVWSWTKKKLLPIYEQLGVNQELIQEGRQNLISHLQSKGYFDAKVDVQVMQQPAGETILYQISKGPRQFLATLFSSWRPSVPAENGWWESSRKW